MFSLLTLASILENNQTYALYAHPSHWMRQPKTRFHSEILATPEPSTQPAPEQKGTIFSLSNSLKPDPLENPVKPPEASQVAADCQYIFNIVGIIHDFLVFHRQLG